jgi:hypothetical protein
MTGGDWRDGGFRQRRPSVATLAWVAASMGRGSRVVGYRRLTGGVCSAVNRLTVERRGMGVTLDPWWDLYALLHYDDSGPKWIRRQVAGRRPVDVPGMTSRVEVAIETALRRLG